MPGKTPNGIPYVLPNDTIATFPTVSKQIAEAVDKSRELVGAWIPLTLTGAWKPFPKPFGGSSPYNGLRVRKVPQGMQIDGAVKTTNEYEVIAELPSAFKPKMDTYLTVFDIKGPAFIAIKPSTSTGSPGITFVSGTNTERTVIVSAIVPLD